MSDVDRDVRTLLEAKAEEMRLAPEIPGGVVKRARRRRAVTAVVAGTVTLAAAVGFYAGASALLQDTAERDRSVVPAGTDQEPHLPIYPATREELDTIADEVAQGSMPLWQSPRGVAELFAVNVLGWDQEDVEVDDAGEAFPTAPRTMVVSNLSHTRELGYQEAIRTRVTVARLPYPELEMYGVLAAVSEGVTLQRPGPDESPLGQESILFQGTLEFLTEGATVELAVDGGPPASAPVTDGEFSIEGVFPGGLQQWTIISIAVKDDSGETLTLSSAAFGIGISQGSSEVSLGPAPPQVLETLGDIYDAADVGDWEALRALIPEEGFTFSFGLADDPIAYWQDLEAQGEPVLEILATLVQTEPAQSRGTFIFPAPAAEVPQEWDQEDLDVLREIHTEREIRQFQDADLYFGWRVGIERNGTWIFFVAGD